MPSLQEVYDIIVDASGEDSASAKMIKQQMENEEYRENRNQRTFTATVGPSFQTLDKAK